MSLISKDSICGAFCCCHRDKKQPSKRDRMAAVGRKKVQGAHQQVFALVISMGKDFLVSKSF